MGTSCQWVVLRGKVGCYYALQNGSIRGIGIKLSDGSVYHLRRSVHARNTTQEVFYDRG
jgi:hypothetical protein